LLSTTFRRTCVAPTSAAQPFTDDTNASAAPVPRIRERSDISDLEAGIEDDAKAAESAEFTEKRNPRPR